MMPRRLVRPEDIAELYDADRDPAMRLARLTPPPVVPPIVPESLSDYHQRLFWWLGFVIPFLAGFWFLAWKVLSSWVG